MTLETQYDIGDFVESVLDEPGSPGIIVAFMVRGQNHSYQVQWEPQKDANWHLDLEIRPASPKRSIGIPVKLNSREGAGV